ncbi:MAG TPA: ice-binding family protein [Candidatus Nanopelagicaceae bacterium]|jgi:type VI secretion system secreted protein VgrG
MKKLHKFASINILTVTSFLLLFLSAPTPSSALTPSAYLGNAVNFAVLANTPSITNTGTTTLSGTAGNDVGIAPAASFTGAGTVTMTGGTIHLNDTAAQNAQTSLATAYTTLSTMATTKSDPGVELGGQTLTPGVYAHTTFGITTTLTLDGGGDPNAIFVFQSGSTLITADSVASKVVLINQAQACNVYWTVGSAATLGTNSTFVGHVLSVASITAKTGAIIDGQLLSRDAAVTLDSNVITNNNCALPIPTPTPTATVTATPTATPVAPCTATISDLTFTSGGPGATTGRLTWTTSGGGLYQFVGDPTLYPLPYNYGNQTSTWDGSLVNMLPTKIYPVVVRFFANCGLVSQASIFVTNAAAVVTPTPTPTVSATPTPTPTATESPTPVATPTPTPVPTPVETTGPTPPPTEVGGELPKTSSPWYNVLLVGTLLMVFGAVGWATRKNRV